MPDIILSSDVDDFLRSASTSDMQDKIVTDDLITPAKLSAGAPFWQSDGKLEVNAGRIELNPHIVGDDNAYFDFHSTDASNPDFDARIIKSSGNNSDFAIQNIGTGNTNIIQNGVIKATFQGGLDGRTVIGGGAYNSGAYVNLYGSSHATAPNKAVYAAAKHTFTAPLANTANANIVMYMEDQEAELVIANNDSDGSATLKLASFTPSVIFEDRSTDAEDFQLLANSAAFGLKYGDAAGQAQLEDGYLWKSYTSGITSFNPLGRTSLYNDNDEDSQGVEIHAQAGYMTTNRWNSTPFYVNRMGMPAYSSGTTIQTMINGVWAGSINAWEGGGLSIITPSSETVTGANIEIYSGNYTGREGRIYYDGTVHSFRNSNGDTSASFITMNMIQTAAELVVGSNDSSGQANIKVSSFTPSITWEDKSSGASDFQLLADGGTFRVIGGTSNNESQLDNELLRIDSAGRVRIGGENAQGEPPSCYIHGTRDASTFVDRLELQADEIALMNGSNYEVEQLRVTGSNLYKANGMFAVGTEATSVHLSESGGENGVTTHATGYILAARSGGPLVYLNRLNANGDLVNFRYNGAEVGQLGTWADTELYFGAGESNLRFGSGGTSIIPCNSVGTARDDTIDLGGVAARFDDIYATNATIQTSDINEKQDIEELSEAEQRVAVACKALLRKFRWKSAVEEKGDDARIHFGIIAQDLQAAFVAEGLDVGRYAMFTSTTWWEKDRFVPAVEEELDEEGNVITEAQESYTTTVTWDTEEEADAGAVSKTRMGVRYSELLAFIIAAI